MNEQPRKNLNPLKVFLIGLVALICLGAIAIFIDQSMIHERDRVESTGKLEDRSLINIQADLILFKIQYRMLPQETVIKAEEDLEAQTLPGKVALAVIELNEAKASLAKDDDSLAVEFKKLRDLEDKFINENPDSIWKSREIEKKLKTFATYTDRVLFEHHLASGPEKNALHDESLRIHSIKLSEVLQGGYEAEIVLRLEKERQDLTESNIRKYQSRKSAAE